MNRRGAGSVCSDHFSDSMNARILAQPSMMLSSQQAKLSRTCPRAHAPKSSPGTTATLASSSNASANDRAEVIAVLKRHTTASLLALLDETYSRGDWLAECARIRCPVLVIAGETEHFPDVAMSRRLSETIPDARLHVVENAPHVPNRTHRAEVQREIGAFLADIGVLVAA